VLSQRETAQQLREQEVELRAKTAKAWSRVRAACYELRLGNLHDLAEGIVSGQFDMSGAETSAAGIE